MVLAAFTLMFMGFGAAYYAGRLGAVPALVAGTALSATSVGVSTAIWQEAHALRSSTGQLLIDVGELDDMSAVILMALLFAQTFATDRAAGDRGEAT